MPKDGGGRDGVSRSVHHQIAVDFPLADMRAVGVPFLFLAFDILGEDMLTEGFADHAVRFQAVNGIAQCAGQGLNAPGFAGALNS